eukprot:542709-Prorocentrum_minimum.AAC.1
MTNNGSANSNERRLRALRLRTAALRSHLPRRGGAGSLVIWVSGFLVWGYDPNDQYLVVSRGSFSFLPPRNDKRPRYDAAGGAGGTVLQLHAPAEAARVSVRGECGARGRAGCVGGRRRPLEGRPNPPPHPPHHLPQPRPAPGEWPIITNNDQ